MTDEFRHVRVEDLPDAPNPTRHKKEVDEAVYVLSRAECGVESDRLTPGPR